MNTPSRTAPLLAATTCLIFLLPAFSFAEVSPPEVGVIDIETDSVPEFLAYTQEGDTQYLVVVEPFLIEIFGYRPGSGLGLVDSEPHDALLEKCAIGEFNGDGYWDLAATEILCGAVSVWLGNGEGDVSYHGSYDTQAPSPDRLVAGDFDEDGRDDLLVVDFYGGTDVVMLNDGRGNFFHHADYDDGAGNQEAILSDFNGDGHLDYIVTTQTYNESVQRFGDGTGDFFMPQAYDICSDGYTSSLADIDEDGIADYICGTGRDIRLFRGRPSGLFSHSSDSFGFGYGPIQYRSVVGDFNGDGHRDVCTFITGTNGDPTSDLQFWYGDGSGSLSPTGRYHVDGIDLPREVWPLAVTLNRDAKTDLLIPCYSPDHPMVKALIMR